jgi:hypothetical protein
MTSPPDAASRVVERLGGLLYVYTVLLTKERIVTTSIRAENIRSQGGKAGAGFGFCASFGEVSMLI